jgi:hypothetical protein
MSAAKPCREVSPVRSAFIRGQAAATAADTAFSARSPSSTTCIRNSPDILEANAANFSAGQCLEQASLPQLAPPPGAMPATGKEVSMPRERSSSRARSFSISGINKTGSPGTPRIPIVSSTPK